MNESMKQVRLHTVLLLCLTVSFLTSCREDRQDTDWQNQNFVLDKDLIHDSRDPVDFVLRKAMAHNARFSTFSTNLDIKVDAGGYAIGFGGQLRVRKDSILWISCQKLVFELFRAKITPDTLSFYSKLASMASVYADDTVKLVRQSFGLLQALFMRGIDSVMFQGERTLDSTADSWLIKGISGDSIAWQLHIGKTDLRPSSIGIQVAKDSSTLQISVIYQNDNGFSLNISQNRQLLVKARISYSKPRWNEKISFPFSIPSGIKTEMGHGLLRNLKKSRENGWMTE